MTDSIESKGSIPDYLLPKFDDETDFVSEIGNTTHYSEWSKREAGQRSVFVDGDYNTSIDPSPFAGPSVWESEIF